MAILSRQNVIFFSLIGGVVKDQAKADEDLSIKERVALGVGKGSKRTNDRRCGPSLTPLRYWILSLLIGSTAGGVAKLDSVNYDGKAVARAVESVAESVQESLGEDDG